MQGIHQGLRFEPSVHRRVVVALHQLGLLPGRQVRIAAQSQIAQDVPGEIRPAEIKPVGQHGSALKLRARPVFHYLPEQGQRIRGGNEKEQYIRAKGATELGKLLNEPVRFGRILVINMVSVTGQGCPQQILKTGIFAPEVHQPHLLPCIPPPVDGCRHRRST